MGQLLLTVLALSAVCVALLPLVYLTCGAFAYMRRSRR